MFTARRVSKHLILETKAEAIPGHFTWQPATPALPPVSSDAHHSARAIAENYFKLLISVDIGHSHLARVRGGEGVNTATRGMLPLSSITYFAASPLEHGTHKRPGGETTKGETSVMVWTIAT